MDAAQGVQPARRRLGVGSGVGLGVSVGTCGDVGAGAGVVASSRASARPVARAVALARVVARQHGLGGDSGTPLAWAAAARTCRVVVESRKARRAQRDEGSEAREAMRGKRCEGSEAVGSEATGAMPEQAQMNGQKRRFSARAQRADCSLKHESG